MTKVQWDLPANKREQLLFFAVMGALVFGFFNMVHSPQGLRLTQSQKQVKNLKFERDTLKQLALPPEEKVRPLSRKKGVKMKILAGDITSVYRDVSVLLARLTEPVFMGGISLRDLKYAAAEKAQGYEKTDFKMRIRGNFSDVLRFVEKMEEFPALFSVESVNIRAVDNLPQEVESDIGGRFFKMDDGSNRQAATPGGGAS